VVAAIAVGGYCVYLYFTYYYSRQFTRYPEPVAQALRKALYFSNHEPDPQRALKYYKQALELCDEAGLDHFSDDVMGIKIQLAAWLEKIQSFQNSISVLENVYSDCKRWVEVMEKSAAEGTLPKLDPTSAPKEGEPAVPEEPRETMWGKRTRVLGKAIAVSVKLASLYSDEHVLERELAHERLVWAVETILREQQRRAKEGLKEGEGPWMSPEEIGGSMEGELVPLSPQTFVRPVDTDLTCSTCTKLRREEPTSSCRPTLVSSPQTVRGPLSHCPLE
jgi:hypothetical protein